MDEPARKRRKTNSPQDQGRASSPLKKPPRRPSFASPTKASLARFNPNLLPTRPTSSDSATSKPDARGDILNRGKQARAFIFGNSEEQAVQAEIARNEDQTRAGASERPQSREQNVTPRPRRFNSRSRTSTAQEHLNEEEAELPTSPTGRTTDQRDTPRRGVLFSSPSKRPPRLKANSQQSPLRLEPKELESRVLTPIPPDTIDEEPVEIVPERKMTPPDPEMEERKREKERLLQELRGLEEDVAQCAAVIDKLQDQSDAQVLDRTERDDLISLINRISDPEEAASEKGAAPVSRLLCSFLPFSAFPVQPPQSKAVRETTLPSHKPLELDEPLPYLQMFTSFKFTSAVSVARSPGGNKSHSRQKHTLEIVGPQKLLTSTLALTIDGITHEVIDLQVARLSSWASRELGAFVRIKADAKDVSTVCWAISSFWELAKKRAEFWHRCEGAFSHLIPGRTSNDTENVVVRGKPSEAMVRKDLLRHLGRDILVLEDAHVVLKITWRIGFDWTGEAVSTVGVEPAFPRIWSEADENDNLKKIPDTFSSLLERQGVFEATNTMVTLLFAE
ncbi:hypothetical protein K491DRAFT_621039 [Lophiostoma macrostomum CBS 122681]|uniref:Uncharacterized protein n=1 Tax=Lophiostoma macrostomum CBS 122681 TaxID=1314788 RepID=A0A6A6TPJ3_9PLEO|nr:hypothetical protein K491DRAFT_621039 [Lophiostoma macrostomum CBS 122681]